MKTFLNKLAEGIKIVFGYGIMLVLFVGGLSIFGYIAAIIIGGDTAAAICNFIYKGMYPVLVYASTSLIILGLIRMYICGESAFKSKKKTK